MAVKCTTRDLYKRSRFARPGQPKVPILSAPERTKVGVFSAPVLQKPHPPYTCPIFQDQAYPFIPQTLKFGGPEKIKDFIKAHTG